MRRFKKQNLAVYREMYLESFVRDQVFHAISQLQRHEEETEKSNYKLNKLLFFLNCIRLTRWINGVLKTAQIRKRYLLIMTFKEDNCMVRYS